MKTVLSCVLCLALGIGLGFQLKHSQQAKLPEHNLLPKPSTEEKG